MRKRIMLSLGAILALTLSGCASSADPVSSPSVSGDAPLKVVASTNVYGAIAQELGGEQLEVTSIIDSSSLDPHSYEASANDQLLIKNADLIILNGGGYDSFMEQMIAATGTEAPVITAVEFSHDYPEHEHAEDEAHAHEHEDDHAHDEHGDEADEHEGHNHIEGFNEHVWYDPHTVEHVAEAISDELAQLRPAAKADFALNGESFVAGIAELETRLDELKGKFEHTEIFLTEPLVYYLISAAGLENVAPDAFTNAVEEGQDVPPAVLAEAIQLVSQRTAKIVVANTQTGGAETTRILDEAAKVSTPVIEFSETLPENTDSYLVWMNANIDELQTALESLSS